MEKIFKVYTYSPRTCCFWLLCRTEKGKSHHMYQLNKSTPFRWSEKARFTEQSKQRLWRHCSTEKLRVLEQWRTYYVPPKWKTTTLLRAASIYGFFSFFKLAKGCRKQEHNQCRQQWILSLLLESVQKSQGGFFPDDVLRPFLGWNQAELFSL